MTEATAALRWRQTHTLGDFWGRVGEIVRFGEITLSPFLDLAIRLWLAQIFWVSGILKLMDWDRALTLAAEEYPVAWMEPVTAAYVGVSIEVICPVLLALGLATRLAAMPMLILSLVIQFEYQQINAHLYWAVLFGWYVVMGPGPFSLDRLFAAGLAASALPSIRWLGQFFNALTRFIGPLYQLFIRLWLALMLAGLVMIGQPELGLWLGLITPALLTLGLATRLVALIAIVLSLNMEFTMALTKLQRIDHLYWLMLLGLVALRGPGLLAADQVFKE